MISVRNVSKRFSSKLAIDSISFETKRGEIIGFLGLNGAGKTTTMRLILGYLRPTSGSISINGQSPLLARVPVLQNIGYLAENNPLYADMKVEEFLDFIARLKNEKNIQNIIQSVDIVGKEHMKIEELSRGYKQRVGLAAALCGNPEILLLDEPTSGLDPLEQEKIRNLIKKLSAKKTILFSTHILSEAEEIADRLIIIHKGKIAYDDKKPKKKGAVELLFKKLVKS